MRILRTVASLREWRSAQGDVGFVPTMGALHAGHRGLVARAVADGTTVVSIFVNPTQFGPNEDYRTYPRSEEADLELLRAAGCAAVFVPTADEVYPPGDDTRVVPGGIASRLEGAARPGHFAGVCTVVAKLFGMVRPQRAYFGQKDFQQLRVIQTMVRHLAMPIDVIPFEIVREPDGLALSSRNAYLSAGERRSAAGLSRSLAAARDAWDHGERDPARLRAVVEGMARDVGQLEYVSAADPFSLVELDARAERVVISLACRLGRARLIDNVLLGLPLDQLR
jgi:pantoate--beta-alanine ligase